MFGPAVAPWVKERYNFTAGRVDSGQVWSLVEIAPVACQRQIAIIVGPAMLLGNDMFNVVCESTVLLTEQAIFAAFACPAADKFPCGGIHC